MRMSGLVIGGSARGSRSRAEGNQSIADVIYDLAEHPRWDGESARRNHPAWVGEPGREEAASVAAPQRAADASVDPSDARNATVGSEIRLDFFAADSYAGR
jgi:hypothetical protein